MHLQNISKRSDRPTLQQSQLGEYICISLITYWSQHSYSQATICGWELVEMFLLRLISTILIMFSSHVWMPLNLSCVIHPGVNESAVRSTTYKQEMMSRGRKPQHNALTHTLTPRHAGSVEVLFSTKVQLYQIWIYFYSKVQHIPSASDYIKTYNVHTVDISTLPFTVSGLNRHYFSGFFISTTNNQT